MRIYQLKQKEVINLTDGKRLGYITDVEFQEKTGCIIAFIVPGPGCICGIFGREQEYRIPFSKVCQIGEDFVIIEACTEEILKKGAE